jgi:hypothetical protein
MRGTIDEVGAPPASRLRCDAPAARSSDRSISATSTPTVSATQEASPERVGSTTVVGVPPHHAFGVTLRPPDWLRTALIQFNSPPGCRIGRHHSPGLANRTGARGDGPQGEGPGWARVSLRAIPDFDSRHPTTQEATTVRVGSTTVVGVPPHHAFGVTLRPREMLARA